MESPSESFNWGSGILPLLPSVFQQNRHSSVSFQLSTTQYLDPEWIYPQFLANAPSPSTLTERGQIPAISHQIKNSQSQQIWEIQEPGETYSNPSWTPEELDGYKWPWLVPWPWFLIEFRWSREICSGSLHLGHQSCSLKKYSYNQMVELFYLVGMFRTLSLEGRISVALRKLLQGHNRGLVGRGCGGSQAIYKFAT